MANHLRKQVRDALSTIVGTITDFVTVTTQLALPAELADVPMASIRTPVEFNARETIGYPGVMSRVMRSQIVVFVAASDAQQDVGDAICVKLEQALFLNETNATLGGIARAMTLIGVHVENVVSGENTWCRIVNELEIKLMALETDPTTHL